MRARRIAYLSMGTGIYNDFLTYGGGLEMLAGDMAKEISDHRQVSKNDNNSFISDMVDNTMSCPVTFFHILWKKGYCYQHVNIDGTIVDVEPAENNWAKYVEDTGKMVTVQISHKDVKLKIWKMIGQFENADVYFLDADLEENGDMCNLTYNLYGGAWDDRESERIAQEIILGVGSVRAVEALGLYIDGYHYNDGHPAFAGLELVARQMKALPPTLQGAERFNLALKYVKAHTVFTTHTNVPAGNESHSIDDMMRLGANAGLSYEQVEHIGGNPFNMTVASLRLSCAANGVSRLQTHAAQEMWKWTSNAPNIIAITNGVHEKTWKHSDIVLAGNKPSAIWNAHQKLKYELIQEIDKRTHVKFNMDSLLIAFARRATEYKRWNLIFKDRARFKQLVDRYNIQIVFTGKAHRNDDSGKAFIAEVVNLTKEYPYNVVFLEGYDIELAKKLVSGADIWLNNPRVPYEACGTSGMKAAMNGVLNVSTPDGWWREFVIDGVNGWTINPEYKFDSVQEDTVAQDMIDANTLYAIIEYSVLKAYKDKKLWRRMMLASINTSRQFTASRMVEEYFTNLYSQIKID